MADRLELEARFNDHASAGVKRLGKVLEGVRPSNGMMAAQKWMGEFRGAAEKANVAVRPLSTGLSAVGIGGLAASLSMGELVKQFKELADDTLTMKELGRQSRMSATEIARLQYAAGKLHVDPGAVNGAINSWSSKMVEFRRHTGLFYTELLRQNSDVARKIAADSPVDGLKDTLDFLSRIKDPQIQKRWADEAGLGDVVPMLGKGPQGLAEAFAEAAREVKPISQEIVDAAERLNASVNKFNQSWSNLKNDIGPSILDPLSHTIDKLDDALKFAAQYPGDAAAAAATIAGSLAALYARARIMRGSKLAGGGGAMDRAAGEMAGAASEQKVATTTFAEAVAEFRAGVREMAARGGVPGGGAGNALGEGGKPIGEGGKSPGYTSLTTGGILAALNLFELAQGTPEQLERAKTDNAPMDPETAVAAGLGDRLRQFFRGGGARQLSTAPAIEEDRATRARDIGGPPRHNDEAAADRAAPASASDKWQAPSRYSSEARARDDARGVKAFDGDVLRRNDETPITSLPAHELFATVKQGSKEGIVAGLREMAQQEELEGVGGGGGSGDGGAKNLRYGRASGGWHTTPGRHSGGGAGSDHGSSGPTGIDYSAKSAQEQMKISKSEWDAYREGVTDIEGKRYDRMGGGGGRYAGRYQMGPAEIDATAQRLGVARPSNAQFLADPAMQERFFENYTMDHRRSLMHDPKFAALSAREQLKILGYAHNQGAGGPANSRHGANGAWGYLENGRAGHDGFGTSGAAYPRTIQRRFDQIDRAPPAGAGIPAPSAKAVDDAEVFAARQRMVNGSRNPADQAIVDTYLKQQNRPKPHASGGFIRGPGGPRSDSIPAMLSNGEFVVRASSAGRFLPLLHAINSGGLPQYADGGAVAAGLARHRSWRDFFRRPAKDGGMGAPQHVALGAMAMMMGESGKWLKPTLYGEDVNGKSGGSAQWHDVERGPYKGKVHRLSDMMSFAMQQHADWKDVSLQQAWFRKEATGSMAYAWNAMKRARTAAGTLSAGVHRYEVPARADLEVLKRMPNIVKLAREGAEGGGSGVTDRVAHDPVEVTIRHHPNGRTSVSGRAGKGVKLGIRSGPTMQPT